ncbi:MAG: hypothetical protein IIC56_06290 [Proteobacteria bacterium]|nr:hypothetical protein [Pseudomonadota bacterium]
MATTTARTPIGASGDRDTGTPPGTESGPQFRTMPHNIEAEKGLLGGIFVNNRAYETVSEFLRPEHFSYQQHGRIFEAAAKLIERGQIADPVTLRRYFEADENLADIGGPAYLAELAASAVTVINAGEYGHLVYDLFLKRELIALGEDVVNDAYGGEVDQTATDMIESAEQNLYDLATSGEYEGGFQPFKDAVVTAIKMAEAAHSREGGLAGVGTGVWSSVPEACSATIRVEERCQPDEDRTAVYNRYYPIYQALYASLKDRFAEAARATGQL